MSAHNTHNHIQTHNISGSNNTHSNGNMSIGNISRMGSIGNMFSRHSGPLPPIIIFNTSTTCTTTSINTNTNTSTASGLSTNITSTNSSHTSHDIATISTTANSGSNSNGSNGIDADTKPHNINSNALYARGDDSNDGITSEHTSTNHLSNINHSHEPLMVVRAPRIASTSDLNPHSLSIHSTSTHSTSSHSSSSHSTSSHPSSNHISTAASTSIASTGNGHVSSGSNERINIRPRITFNNSNGNAIGNTDDIRDGISNGDNTNTSLTRVPTQLSSIQPPHNASDTVTTAANPVSKSTKMRRSVSLEAPTIDKSLPSTTSTKGSHRRSFDSNTSAKRLTDKLQPMTPMGSNDSTSRMCPFCGEILTQQRHVCAAISSKGSMVSLPSPSKPVMLASLTIKPSSSASLIDSEAMENYRPLPSRLGRHASLLELVEAYDAGDAPNAAAKVISNSKRLLGDYREDQLTLHPLPDVDKIVGRTVVKYHDKVKHYDRVIGAQFKKLAAL